MQTINFTTAKNDKLYDEFIANRQSTEAVKDTARALNEIATLRGRDNVVDTWEARIFFGGIEKVNQEHAGSSDWYKAEKLLDYMQLRVVQYQEQQRTR